MPTILLWRLGALGDTVLTLPALAALRATFPAHEIVCAGRPSAFAPALWSGYADRVIDAADPRLAPLTASAVPGAGGLPPDLTSAVVWSTRHQEIAAGLAAAGIRQVVAAPALPPPGTHIVDHYLATLAPLGAAPVAYSLRPPAEALARTRADWQRATRERDEPVVLLHPGAGSALKRWPLARYRALAAAMRAGGATVVWSTGPADDSLAATLRSWGEGDHPLPPADVAGLAAHLSRAAVVVSGDCGVAHLAALLDAPTVTLFGPTDPYLWRPPARDGSALSLALPCSPCGEVARRCPSRICLRGLSVAAVTAAVQARLHRRSAYTDRPIAPYWRADLRCPPPAPAPPAPLQVAVWAGGRRWAAPRSTAP